MGKLTLLMISVLAVAPAWAQIPPRETPDLLGVQEQAPPVTEVPGGGHGTPAATPVQTPPRTVTQDGATLSVTTSYVGTFAKFHVDAHVDGEDIQRVDWTGPGRYQRTVTDPAGGFAVALETDQPFTLHARVRRGRDPKPLDLSLPVTPQVLSLPLRPGLVPAAVATAMRTGGWQYELRLNGDLAAAPAVVATEWTLPEGFKQPIQRSTDASTGFGVTGDFDKPFSATVRVLYADGTVGLGVLRVEPQQ